MNYPKIVPNGWLESSQQFFTSFVTLQETAQTQTPDGAIVNEWADVDELTMMPCAVAVVSTGSISQQEQRQPDKTSTDRKWHITIKGYHANLIDNSQRAQVFKIRDSVSEHIMSLNVIGVEQDSHSIMTRLLCEVLSYHAKPER